MWYAGWGDLRYSPLVTLPLFCGVEWVHAVVIFSGQKQNGWIRGSILHVMVGRVGIQCLELARILHRTELRSVECAIRIEFYPQHVIDANFRNDRPEEIGTLRKHSSHQQPAVTASDNRKVGGRRVLAVDEVFSCTDEIVKDILFVSEIAGTVPLFTVFSATP